MNGEDIGGGLAWAELEAERRADLEEDRERRLWLLKGRYIIVANGKHQKLYLQDRRISQGHYWTKFLSNAISFETIQGATQECRKYKFNDPKVYLVDNQLKLNVISLTNLQ